MKKLFYLSLFLSLSFSVVAADDAQTLQSSAPDPKGMELVSKSPTGSPSATGKVQGSENNTTIINNKTEIIVPPPKPEPPEPKPITDNDLGRLVRKLMGQ